MKPTIAEIVYDSKDRAEAVRLLTELGQLRDGKLYVTPKQYSEIWRRESQAPLSLASPSGIIPADSIEVVVVSDPLSRPT
jgi:hypothetical protein